MHTNIVISNTKYNYSICANYLPPVGDVFCIILILLWYYCFMASERPRQTVVLPPPAGTILLYAADGLSSWRGHLSPAGKPCTPNRSHWVPMFRQLVDSDEGMQTLRTLAEAGMRAWNCPPGIVGCLGDAFCDITFRALSIAALQNFAETAREKVVLPGSEPPQYPVATKNRPKPEQPSQNRPATSPHRPHPRGGGMKPAPH